MMIGTAFRYGCVGILGTLIHVGILVVLVEFFAFPPAPGSVAGFIVTVLVSYLLNRYWTFAHQKPGQWVFVRYVVVSCTGVVLTYGLMVLATDVMHWHYLYGQMLVIALIPLTNFLMNYYWTFVPNRVEN